MNPPTAPKGEPVKKPLTKAEIVAKFRANVDFSQTVPRDNAEKALRLLEKLEELDNVNKIVALLITKK